jgi:hypothetical protein
LVGSGAAVAKLIWLATRAVDRVIAIAVLMMLIAALLSRERINKETNESLFRSAAASLDLHQASLTTAARFPHRAR